jgi:hypothetical protein
VVVQSGAGQGRSISIVMFVQWVRNAAGFGSRTELRDTISCELEHALVEQSDYHEKGCAAEARKGVQNELKSVP